MNNKVYKKSKYEKVKLLIFTSIWFSWFSYLIFFTTELHDKLYFIYIFSFLCLLHAFEVYRFFRFKVIVSNDTVHKRNIMTSTILFKDVISAELYKGNLTIFNMYTRICFKDDLEKQKEVISFIVNKIKDNPNIDIYGDKYTIEGFGLEVYTI